MSDAATASKERLRHFVHSVAASRKVWGLRDADRWACTTWRDKDRQDRTVLLFWSDRADAKQRVKGKWLDYQPIAIPLESFLQRWLTGMATDGRIAGIEWDALFCGPVIEPLDLKQEIEGQIKSGGLL